MTVASSFSRTECDCRIATATSGSAIAITAPIAHLRPTFKATRIVPATPCQTAVGHGSDCSFDSRGSATSRRALERLSYSMCRGRTGIETQRLLDVRASLCRPAEVRSVNGEPDVRVRVAWIETDGFLQLSNRVRESTGQIEAGAEPAVGGGEVRSRRERLAREGLRQSRRLQLNGERGERDPSIRVVLDRRPHAFEHTDRLVAFPGGAERPH